MVRRFYPTDELNKNTQIAHGMDRSGTVEPLGLHCVLVVNCSAQSWKDYCAPCRCYIEERHSKADCRPSFANNLKNVPTNLSIQVNYLELSHQRIYTDIPEDAFFHANGSHLSKLRLHRCDIEKIHKHAFRHLTNLTWLDISHNDIDQLDVGIFHMSDWLDTLWINGNKYRSLDSGLFANLTHLEYVYAYENLISYIAPDAFQNNPKLREVTLNKNKLTHLERSWLDFPNLRELQLAQNPWHCDCKLTALMSEFRRHNLPSDDLECASPLQQTDIGDSVSVPLRDACACRIGNAEHSYRDISIEFHGLSDAC
ncbi:kekkon 4 [Carabus blaptoides fortunei]